MNGNNNVSYKKGAPALLISILTASVIIIGLGILFIVNIKKDNNDTEETSEVTVESSEGVSCSEYADALLNALYEDYIRIHPSSTPTPTPTATPTPSATPTPTATPTPSPVPQNIETAIRNNIDANMEACMTDDEAQDEAEDLIEDVLGLKSRYWSSYLDPEDCAEVFMSSVEYSVDIDYSDVNNGKVVAVLTINRNDYREAFAATLRYYFAEMGYDTDASEDIWDSINPGITTLYNFIDYATDNITWRSFMEIYSGYQDSSDTMSETFEIVYDVTINSSTGKIENIVLSDVRAFDCVREFLWGND